MGSMATSTDYQTLYTLALVENNSLKATITSLNHTIATYQARESELNAWVTEKANLDAQILSLQSDIASKNALLGITAEETTTMIQKYNELQASMLVTDLQTKDLRAYYEQKALKAEEDKNLFMETTNVRFELLKAKFPFDLALSLVRYDSNSSLNGKGCEFKDGESVSVSGRVFPYIVVRSFQTLVGDSSYTVMYDLIAENGSVLTAPEAMLTSYVSTISEILNQGV